MIPSKVLDVHLRLLQQLPVRKIPDRRVLSLPCTVYSDRKPGRLAKEEQRRLYERVHKLAACGVERPDIAEAMNLSTATVDRYLANNCSIAAEAAQPRRQ